MWNREVNSFLEELEGRTSELKIWEKYKISDFPAIKTNIEWVIAAIKTEKTKGSYSSNIIQERINNWSILLDWNMSFEIVDIAISQVIQWDQIIQWEVAVIKLNWKQYNIPKSWLKHWSKK